MLLCYSNITVLLFQFIIFLKSVAWRKSFKVSFKGQCVSPVPFGQLWASLQHPPITDLFEQLLVVWSLRPQADWDRQMWAVSLWLKPRTQPLPRHLLLKHQQPKKRPQRTLAWLKHEGYRKITLKKVSLYTSQKKHHLLKHIFTVFA